MQTPFQLRAEPRALLADRGRRESLAAGADHWRPKLNDSLPLRMLLAVLVNGAADDAPWIPAEESHVLCKL